jgi:hypothetical protein
LAGGGSKLSLWTNNGRLVTKISPNEPCGELHSLYEAKLSMKRSISKRCQYELGGEEFAGQACIDIPLYVSVIRCGQYIEIQ